MSKTFVHLSISVDGFVAGENRGPRNPLGDSGLSLHTWAFQQKVFRGRLTFEEGGETGADNRFLEEIMNRIGANILGKRMFEEGEANWPEEAPFRTPVFVLTKESRAPWERKGGTTFHFVNEPIERVLEKARSAAGGRDVRICGGRDLVHRYLAAGLVDELVLSIAPVFLGKGLRLFEGLDVTQRKLGLEIMETIASPKVTHVRYALQR